MIAKTDMSSMEETAKRMVARGKGILAADESFGTIAKRFASIGIVASAENRREFRELLFRTREALQECVSGVILFEETWRQNAADGIRLVDLIRETGAIPGIKVDQGLAPLDGKASSETFTKGLEGLSDRLSEFSESGALFAKWRAVFRIDDGMPSNRALSLNSDGLASFAKQCQEVGLVPIVEPEVLMEGQHDIDQCGTASAAVLSAVFKALRREDVRLEAIVLKPNMITPGESSSKRVDCNTIAEKTLSCFSEAVPSMVPGIAFLSGGQKDVEATANLNAINLLSNKLDMPWALTFSFGRALQAGALRTWKGRKENIPAAQAEFHKRACMNAKASVGIWSADLE